VSPASTARPCIDVSTLIRSRIQRGFTLVEALVSVVVIAALLAMLLPALYRARYTARRDQCALNQKTIGVGWQRYFKEHGAFPDAGSDPEWTYAGVTFSRLDGSPALDFARPLNPFLTSIWRTSSGDPVFRSPLDRGIDDPTNGEDQIEQSVYAARGTSYRANGRALRADVNGDVRPLRVAEVAADHDRFVIMGAPLWYEVLHDTGRSANWYAAPRRGLVLFMDGSVRGIAVEPGKVSGEDFTFDPGRRPTGPRGAADITNGDS